MRTLVYPVREGLTPDRNEELRYSLRSVAVNFPADRIMLVGYCPAWVTGVDHVPVVQRYRKHSNTWAVWQAIAAEAPDDFVFMNDDFFAVRPISDIADYHAGALLAWIRDHAGAGSTAARVSNTVDLLVSLGLSRHTLLSYELHVPMHMQRVKLAEALALGTGWVTQHRLSEPLAKRSLYGNLAQLAATYSLDVKARTRDEMPPRSASFVSTSHASFGYGRIGRTIRAAFPDPSPYEIPSTVPRPARQHRASDETARAVA